MSLSFLGLNTLQPPLDQPWLRQAIGHAMNRQALVEDSWELLKKKPAVADILKRRQELTDCGQPLPDSLAEALENALQHIEQRRKNRRRCSQWAFPTW
jgi:ABC-type transport system substrate-binding protein